MHFAHALCALDTPDQTVLRLLAQFSEAACKQEGVLRLIKTDLSDVINLHKLIDLNQFHFELTCDSFQQLPKTARVLAIAQLMQSGPEPSLQISVERPWLTWAPAACCR